MNLCIDIGNTMAKVVVFSGNEMTDYKQFNVFSMDEMKQYIQKKKNIQSAILCSVRKDIKALEQFLAKICSFIYFDEHTSIPLKNQYKTPQTLGKDRLAASVAANHLFPNQNVLVIDAGTCITYDLVSEDNVYLGGAISPGIKMRFNALNTFTDKLPLVHPTAKFPWIGCDTVSSILSGVGNGVLLEVEGFIQSYKERYKEVKVVFTGGDLAYFEKELKIIIFAEPYLVLKGLNIILEYNKN